MTTVLRAEVQISAQNQLRPGLAKAAAALESFRQKNTKLTAQAAQMERMERAANAMRGAFAGLTAGAALASFNAMSKRYAEVERSMTRIALTGDATREQQREGTSQMRDLAREVALPFDQVRDGLDQITASGREFGAAIKMMPSVARAAQASGAAVGDIAGTTTALIDHMKISIEGLQEAQDTLTAAGAAGKFELKDMARYLPSMLPAFKALGYEGQDGLRRLSVILQTIRAGTGNAEEAAASANNIFAKMESEATVKNFKDMGVDLPKALANARKEGKDLLDVFVNLSRTALKGDLSKLPQLFNDMEFARGMRALLTGAETASRVRTALASSGGAVDARLKRVLEDQKTSYDRLAEAADRASAATGAFAIRAAAPILDRASKELASYASDLERIEATLARLGWRGMVKAEANRPAQSADPSSLPFFNEELGRLYRGGRFDEIKKARDAKKFRDDYDKKLAEIDQGILTEKGRLDSVPVGTAGRGFTKRTIDGRVARLESERASIVQARAAYEAAQVAIAEHQARISGTQTRFGQPGQPGMLPVSPGMMHTFGRTRFGQSSGADHPDPPRRPDMAGGVPMLKDLSSLDAAATKATTVKDAIVDIGPAGAIAGSQISAGLNSPLDAALAKVMRIKQELATMRAPSLSFSGLNTGPSMNEAR